MFKYILTEVRQDANIPFYEFPQSFYDYIDGTHPESKFTEVIDQDNKRRVRTSEWDTETSYVSMINDPIVIAGGEDKINYNNQNGITWTTQFIPK
jgi:hypothetical protein